MHAAFHVVVENQIAEELEPVCRAMVRLAKEGLSRHDAVHAIGSVAAESIYGTLTSKDQGSRGMPQEQYNAAVERLTAKEWRRECGA